MSYSILAPATQARLRIRPTPGPGGPGPVVLVTVNPSSFGLSVGSTRQLSATATDAAGATVPGTATWASSNTAVATVDATGLVTAIAAGTAVITATVDGIEGSSVVATSTATFVADFELAVYHDGDVQLHDLSVAAPGQTLVNGIIDWGDDTPTEPLLGSSQQPMPTKYLHHPYKASGTYTVTLTVTDDAGGVEVATQEITIVLPATVDPVPYGRFFDGVDQFPGAHPTLTTAAQPFRYLDTTYPESFAATLTASTEDGLTDAFNALGESGGRILWTGGNIDSWRMPARPFDANGVEFDTVIVIETHSSTHPSTAPEPGTRVTPGFGEQLPAFRAINYDGSACAINMAINDQYCYGVRFVLWGITVNQTFIDYGLFTGGQLVLYGSRNRRITFDRCCSYLPDESVAPVACRRDFYIKGGDHAWLDGWHWGNRDYNTDSQAIGGWSLNGSLKVVNCFLGPAGEPFMTGGAAPEDATNPDLPYRPTDMEIRMCHLWRDQGYVRSNIRYYTSGFLIADDVPVAGWDPTTRVLTLAEPIPTPGVINGFDVPAPALRRDWVVYIKSGKGAGEGMVVSSVTDSTHLTMYPATRSYPVKRGWEGDPPDETSVVRIAFKVGWFSKNCGEFKDMRRAWISECVFENGSEGIGQQYNMMNMKTTVNSGIDYHPMTADITILDCVYLNCHGGINISALPRIQIAGTWTAYGHPARRFHLENLLLIAGKPREISTASSDETGTIHNKVLGLGADHIYAKGITALGFRNKLCSWQEYQGGATELAEYNTIRGLIAEAPRTTKTTAGWFVQLSHLDTATADITGNAVFGTTGMPTGTPGTWHTDPEMDPANVFNNPDKTDLWGAGDFEVQPTKTALIAATPERLDWTRLQARTAGVRASTSDIPYQWDD